MSQNEIGMSVRQRVPYEPIVNRAPFKLPGNARVAVWTIVNVENWQPTGPMPRTVLPPPMGQPLLPDVPNWAWHEYGMRVGFWRFVEVLKARNIKASFAVNGSAIEVYRAACEAARTADWDFMGHGFVQKPMHKVEDQALAIQQTIDAIREFTGKPPRGWESPGLTETDETVSSVTRCPSSVMGRTSRECITRRRSRRSDLHKSTMREALTPPAVEPAQPPKNITSTRIQRQNCGQRSKSSVQ